VTYFPDYSPYGYGHASHLGVVHVGWLDNIHPYPKGTVDARLIEKMKLLASIPVELYMGTHTCELCAEPSDLLQTTQPNGVGLGPNSSWLRWADQRSGNGEIRVSRGGTIFAAPVLIVHYIEAHSYLPPTQFLKAVEEADSQKMQREQQLQQRESEIATLQLLLSQLRRMQSGRKSEKVERQIEQLELLLKDLQQAHYYRQPSCTRPIEGASPERPRDQERHRPRNRRPGDPLRRSFRGGSWPDRYAVICRSFASGKNVLLV
jgi:hypothetical protein